MVMGYHRHMIEFAIRPINNPYSWLNANLSTESDEKPEVEKDYIVNLKAKTL